MFLFWNSLICFFIQKPKQICLQSYKTQKEQKLVLEIVVIFAWYIM